MIYPNYLVTGKHQTGRRFSMIFRKDRLVSKRGSHLQIFCEYKRPIKVTDDAEIDADIRLYPAYWEYSARN